MMKILAKKLVGFVASLALLVGIGVTATSTRVVADTVDSQYANYLTFDDMGTAATLSGYSEKGVQVDLPAAKGGGVYTNYASVTNGNSLSISFIIPKYDANTTSSDNCTLNTDSVSAQNITELSFPIVGKKANGNTVWARFYFNIGNYASVGAVRGGLISSASVNNWTYLVGDAKAVSLYGAPNVNNEFTIQFNMTEGFKTKWNGTDGTTITQMYKNDNLTTILDFFAGVTEMKIGIASQGTVAGSVYITEVNGTSLKVAGINATQSTKKQTLGEAFDASTITKVEKVNAAGTALCEVADYTLSNTEALTLADQTIDVVCGSYTDTLAIEYAEYFMVEGATLRLEGENGLRFTAKILKSDYEAILAAAGADKVVLGMRIVRNNNAYVDVIAENTVEKDGYIVFSGVVTDIVENGNTEATYKACAYMDVKLADDSVVKYYAAYNNNKTTYAAELAKVEG